MKLQLKIRHPHINSIRPLYYIINDFYLNLFHKDLILKNATLKNKYKNQRIFFLLTGESLNHIDIPKLEGEYTFGLSYIYFNDDVKNLPLTFYSCFEPWRGVGKVVENWPEKFLPSKGNNKKIIYYNKVKEYYLNSDTVTFVNANNLYYLKKLKILNHNEDNIYFIRLRNNIKNIGRPNLELTKRINSGNGSFFHALLMMIYMGFNKIYLCGAGYTYYPEYLLHFYDNDIFPRFIGFKEAEQQAKKALKVRNIGHGTLEYYGLNQKGDHYRAIYVTRKNKNNLNHYDYHKRINKYAKTQGIKILNIVPDGFDSPVYEKMSWENVVSDVLPNK